MYFQNIQNNLPKHLVYVPYITLKHHWMMGKYYNLMDLQGNWQNPSLTNPKYSDAIYHSQTYCALSAFMTTPTAFMLTQFLKGEERNELRKLIAIYKKHRTKLYNSIIIPIGSQPDNASWTGFQFYIPGKNEGYLMVFRELHNKNKQADLKLQFFENQTLKVEELLEDQIRNTKLKNGKIEMVLENPATATFLKYTVLD